MARVLLADSLWGANWPGSEKAVNPIFGPCLLWPNGSWIKMPLGSEVGPGPGDVVRFGLSPPLKGE